MGDPADHATSLSTEQRHNIKPFDIGRRVSATQSATQGTRAPPSIGTRSPAFAPLQGRAPSGPGPDQYHGTAFFDMAQPSSTNRRHSHTPGFEATRISPSMYTERPMLDRPIPPIFSLPPLASIHDTADDKQLNIIGKQSTCKHCETFITLVPELCDVTALLLSDARHLSESTDFPSSGFPATNDSNDAQVHVSNFYRSLQELRALRRTISRLVQRDAGFVGGSPFSPPGQERTYMDSSALPPRPSSAYQMVPEPPQKRLRYDSPSPQSSGVRVLSDSGWRLGEPVELAAENNSVHAVRSSRAGQIQAAPTSPTSDHLSRFLPSPHSLSTPYAPPRRASMSGTASQPPSLIQFEEFPTTATVPFSSASIQSHSHSSSSAESTHYAHLQRQITLKTLSLQTLQSEYSSLLQKLQRERLRSQTMERKSSVAESEVNTLSTQNEELTEQIKDLQTQIREREEKIESQRWESNRDKAQWVDIISNGSKIMARFSDDQLVGTEQKVKSQAPVPGLATCAAGSDAMDMARPTHEEVARLQSRLDESLSTIGRLRQALSSSKDDSEILKIQAGALMEAIAAANERATLALSEPG